MSEQLQRFFVGQDNDQKRFEVVSKALGITPAGDFSFGLYGSVSAALADYRDWKRSQYQVWPFAGGRRQQPRWVLDNFATLELVEEYFDLRKKLKLAPAQLEKLPASADIVKLFT